VHDDRSSPLRERLDQGPLDAVDAGVTVDQRLSGDPEPNGEFVTDLHLVEHPGGLGVGEQLTRIQRPPDTGVVSPRAHSGDTDVGARKV
jgi:hypothetical protein